MTACGGGVEVNLAPSTYTVEGTVSGLNGRLVLQNNNESYIAIYENGRFAFTTALANGKAYNITVPLKPLRQSCAVSNASGTIRSANVTNIQVICTNKTGGVTLSGKIAVPQGVVIDGTVNDWKEKYEQPNDTWGTAQVLPNPITVGGYVNRPGAGTSGRLNNRLTTQGIDGNPYDFYIVELKKDDGITLTIGASDTVRNSLDLWLFDVNSDKDGDSSPNYGNYAMLRAPYDGTYYVVVRAYRGASNYILAIGADMAVAEAIAATDGRILSTQHEIVPDQVVVRFKDNVKAASSTDQTLGQYAENMGLTAISGAPEREMLFAIDDVKLQSYSQNDTDAALEPIEQKISLGPEKARLLNTLRTINELRKHEDILSAEPNYIVHASAIPNDEHYKLQWHYPLIQLPEAWEITKGSDNVIVAVVDTGVLMDHPDLRNRLTNTGYSFVSGETGGIGSNPNDPGGGVSGVASSFHGTHVAGTIAAETNNGIGAAGVTWETKIMPVRVLGKNGSGTSSDVIQGIRYAAGLANDSKTVPTKAADIINLSLGGSGSCSSYQGVINEVRAKGIIIIAAAGNDKTSNPSFPAACDGVISVSAVNIDGTKASYSNYGSHIIVAAPGGDSGDINGDGNQDYILSTGGDDSTGAVVYKYSFKAGTSMAAPHVAGIVALMKAVYSDLSPAILDEMLASLEITDDTSDSDKIQYSKYGLINAFKAVTEASRINDGGEIPGRLDVNPRTVNFGAFNSQTSVVVSQVGTGEFLNIEPSVNVDWLTVEPDSEAGYGLGKYILSVKRDMLLLEGTYMATVTFTASGSSVSVRVTVQVRGTTDINYDAGYHYVMLISSNEDDDIEIAEATAIDQYYSYSFQNIPQGSYIIIAGSDRNNDGWLGDGGEALGAYPTVDQVVEIDASGNMNQLDFQTNLRLAINNENMSYKSVSAPQD